jgi:hypothetical protein
MTLAEQWMAEGCDEDSLHDELWGPFSEHTFGCILPDGELQVEFPDGSSVVCHSRHGWIGGDDIPGFIALLDSIACRTPPRCAVSAAPSEASHSSRARDFFCNRWSSNILPRIDLLQNGFLQTTHLRVEYVRSSSFLVVRFP